MKLKNRLAILILVTLFFTGAVMADSYSAFDGADFTGESYFTNLAPEDTDKKVEDDNINAHGTTAKKSDKHSTPPVKYIRQKIQGHHVKKEQINSQLAPTGAEPYRGEVATSEYASHDLTENFDDMSPDGFEADEETLSEDNAKGGKKHKSSGEVSKEDIILDCDDIDYDTENYLVYARGNANVEFVKQKTNVKADIITFDRLNNTIKAEGNVRIIKHGQTITGDYIFVDLNEENALIENPMTSTDTIVMHAKKGYVYGDKIVQENGSLTIDESYPIEFHQGVRGPRVDLMYVPKNETLSEDMSKGIIKFTAKDIVITQKGDLETVAIKKGKLQKGGKTIFKVPALKVYTNKYHEYGETNIWEIGAYRGLGTYTGPGWVFELPKGSVLKVMPMLNYKSGFGAGILGRFQSGTNTTMAGYAGAVDKFVAYGRQDLDDNLFLQYGVNGYMDEWFMGRRRPKYGVSLVYNNGYSKKGFLLDGRTSLFMHRLEGGYFQDLDFDQNFEKLKGNSMGTTRFRYMAQVNQNFIEKKNPEKLTSFILGVNSQFSASLYGTGDTQVVARIAPVMHVQYKRWMQDLAYYFSADRDGTPMPVFDAYRFGSQMVYLREYLRVCRWLTLSWYGMYNTSNDTVNGRRMQGNAFFITVGPDDFKFNVGYDFIRQTLLCTFDVMMDAKGTHVEYDRLELKQDKKAEKKNEEAETASAKQSEPPVADNPNLAPVSPGVLKKAVVENIRVMDDVL